MRVGVVGCGNVGFSHLKWLNKIGHDVLGYDIDELVKERISNEVGESSVAYNLEELSSCDSIHICVPTEPAYDGSADMSIYEDVINRLAAILRDKSGISVIQRSTCPPGCADRYARKFSNGISYAVNPSFLRKASIEFDTENPERVAIGGTGIAVEHLIKIYRDVVAPMYVTESRTSVELLKYVENTLDAILVSYWNEILEYAVSLGLKAEEVFRLIEKIGDREKFRTVSRIPGKAFGLWCLPKDLSALIIEMKKRGIVPNVMEGGKNTNTFFEQLVGVGFTPAQKLWQMSDGHVQVLEEGKKQIEEYMAGKYDFAK